MGQWDEISQVGDRLKFRGSVMVVANAKSRKFYGVFECDEENCWDKDDGQNFALQASHH